MRKRRENQLIKLGFGLIIALLINTNIIFAKIPDYPQQEGIYLYEKNSDTVIYKQNENARYIPASITKLLTALVLTDTINDLNKVVTVGNEVNDFDYSDSRAGLWEGQQLTYRDLLYAMLVPSGNDAAQTIAINVGKVLANTTDRQIAEQAFYKAMNEKAQSLGAVNSNFVNPHGRHRPDHYTTPEDFVKITEAALNNPDIQAAASARNYTLKKSDGQDNVLNSSDFCLYPDSNSMAAIDGIARLFPNLAPNTVQPNPFYTNLISAAKTGSETEGGRTYAFRSKQGDQDIYGVILKTDSDGIFTQAKATLETLNQTYDTYDLSNLTAKNPIELENKSVLSPGEFEYTYIEDEIYEDKDNLANLKLDYRFDPDLIEEVDGTYLLKQSLNQDEKVGSILVENSNGVTKTIPIYAAKNYYIKNFLDFVVDHALYFGLGLILLLVILGLVFYRKKRQRSYKIQKM